MPLTLHRYGNFVERKSWSKISLTTYLTTYTKFGVKKSIIETWLSLVERCVREHRTLGARYRAVCGTLPLTLHCHGIFGNLKSRSKIHLTTYLTTYTKFGVKKFYNRDVAQFGRALRSGRRGRVFKSRRLDHKKPLKQRL